MVVGELGFCRGAQPGASPEPGGGMAAKITPLETEAEPERAARLAWERRQIDEAREDVRAGRVITGADVDDLLDRFVRGEPLPEAEALPPSRSD